jgi:hypothetical protein
MIVYTDNVPEDWVGYHIREVWDGEQLVGHELMLDERDQPIPDTICICFAHSPFECCCGAWNGVDSTTWEY